MGPCTSGSSTARLAAAATVLAGLTLVAPAAAGAAAGAAPLRPHPALCVRARGQWSRLTLVNQRAKHAFTRAEAFRAQLLRRGRAQLAHRLDTRLRYLRLVHTLLLTRARTLAARVAGVCAARPPALDRF
jgi:hypothetical protein